MNHVGGGGNFGDTKRPPIADEWLLMTDQALHYHQPPTDDPDKTGVSESTKTKHHPSFTLILRKQLPFGAYTNHILGNEQANNTDLPAEQCNVDKSDRNNFTFGTEVAPECKDFELQNSWQIWIMDESIPSTAEWNVKKQGPPVRTARQFWGIYSKLYDTFDERNFKNLMIFKDQIEPKWEDKWNVGGGRWYFDVSYNNRGSDSGRRDCLLKCNYWTQCVETVFSDCLHPLSHLLVGLILNFKPSKYRVSLWTRACDDFNQVICLGTSLRNQLNLRCQLKFELHSSGSAGVGGAESTVLECLN